MSKLSTVLKFLAMGIAVIPLRHRGKEPQSHLMGGTWERYQHELPTEYQVTNWFGSDWLNYGVVCGWRDLAVIDFDNALAFDLWRDYFSILNKHTEVIPMPFIVRTARGAHVYVRMPSGGNNSKRLGVDVKFHGYVVGPGSIHPSGAVYQALATEYHFPEVWDLETILPSDLFPPVANAVPVENITPVEIAPVATEYDPFAMASTGGIDVDLIAKVKSYVRIENLFPNASPTSMDKRWYSMLCPFHDDHHPSFWIDAARQLCGCRSCRMKPMDVINLYARMHNVSESLAVSQLARECGVWG